jgi:hypothetical protein
MDRAIPPLPNGTINVVVSGPRTATFTVAFPAVDVEGVLAGVERRFNYGTADRTNVQRHIFLRARTRERIEGQNPSDDDRREIGQALLWCALHHPTGGASVRAMVTNELLDGGRANISAAYNESRSWAWGVSRDPIDAATVVQGVTMGRGETIILKGPGAP